MFKWLCMYFNDINVSTDLYASIYKMNAGSRKSGEKLLELNTNYKHSINQILKDCGVLSCLLLVWFMHWNLQLCFKMLSFPSPKIGFGLPLLSWHLWVLLLITSGYCWSLDVNQRKLQQEESLQVPGWCEELTGNGKIKMVAMGVEER